MEHTKFTRFTVEVSNREKIVVEFSAEDINIDDICQAFRTMMVGMTFTDKSVGDMLASYLEEYYGELYNVVNINE